MGQPEPKEAYENIFICIVNGLHAFALQFSVEDLANDVMDDQQKENERTREEVRRENQKTREEIRKENEKTREKIRLAVRKLLLVTRIIY